MKTFFTKDKVLGIGDLDDIEINNGEDEPWEMVKEKKKKLTQMQLEDLRQFHAAMNTCTQMGW